MAQHPTQHGGQADVPTQDPHAARKNAEFFADNPDYAERATRLRTYVNLRKVINREIAGQKQLLDLGNGGVFDYDTELVREIVAVDLFQESTAPLPPNASFKEGDALKLPFPDDSFSGALMAMVFHHLTGARASDLVANVERSIAEAHRVLGPGGKFIVVESCIPSWFFGLEQILFAPLARVGKTRLMRHPPALQLPPELLASLVRDRFGALTRCERIPVGALILQFGHRWPTLLTPARPYLLTAQK